MIKSFMGEKKKQALLDLFTGEQPFVDSENFNGIPRKLLRLFCEQTYAQVRACERFLNFFVLRLDLSNLESVGFPHRKVHQF